jgi:RNA polymerase sigma-70 factor, ECF subfamily
MDDSDFLADRFEEHRTRLRAVAYRMLGSLSEADDAVQEAWLRLNRTDADAVENLGGWLTTVVARISLNMLRARRTRREEPFEEIRVPEPIVDRTDGTNPEHEALLADSVGLALLVVLETLSPAERLAFVLHDLFAMPFGEVAGVLGRSPDAARQLASRARRRVRGPPGPGHAADLTRQREVAAAFLVAARGGDMSALVALLDSEVTLTADAAAVPSGRPAVLHGAEMVVRGALAAAARAGESRLALVDGSVGIIFAPAGQLRIVLALTVSDARRITAIDVIADPGRLRRLRLALPPE